MNNYQYSNNYILFNNTNTAHINQSTGYIYENDFEKFNKNSKSASLNEYIFYFNEPIKMGQIPYSTKKLYFLDEFNQPIRKGDIPFNVEEIYFGKKFNQNIDRSVLPKGLLKIIFSYSYKHNLIAGINYPDSIHSIKFGEFYFFENTQQASEAQPCF